MGPTGVVGRERGNKTTSRGSEKQSSQTSQPESPSTQVEHLQLLVIAPS